MILYNFYIIGFGVGHNHANLVNIHSPLNLMIETTRASGISAPILFSSIIAVLLMAHEYRYSTIMYTLTNSNSRSKTILAKLIAVTGFAIIFSLFVEILAPSLALLGMHFHHLTLVHQVFYYRDFFWRVLFFGWAYSMIGLMFAVLFRNVVASIVGLLLTPIIIEPLIGLLLSTNQQQYMPFTALSAVLNNGLLNNVPGQLSAIRSAVIVIAYLLIGWAVGWILFLRRDAS
jgi:ABC-type transport system involved in multi-copper enzyme maturation permease subunit